LLASEQPVTRIRFRLDFVEIVKPAKASNRLIVLLTPVGLRRERDESRELAPISRERARMKDVLAVISEELAPTREDLRGG
jgi:hypothetical protein